MSKLSENIKLYRKASGLTQKELAKKLNVAPTAISAWEVDRNKPLMDNIEKMSEIFHIKKSELLGDTLIELSQSISQAAQEASDELLEELTANYTRLDLKRRSRLVVASSELVKEQIEEQTDIADNIIPFRAEKLFDYEYYDQAASAGTGQYLGDVAKETIQLPIEVDADFVIPIHGDSMEPDYHEGDLIFVELTLNLADGDIGIFSLDGEVYIKQLLIKEGNKAYLHSLNSKYADIPITTNSDFRVIGEVVKSYREK